MQEYVFLVQALITIVTGTFFMFGIVAIADNFNKNKIFFEASAGFIALLFGMLGFFVIGLQWIVAIVISLAGIGIIMNSASRNILSLFGEEECKLCQFFMATGIVFVAGAILLYFLFPTVLIWAVLIVGLLTILIGLFGEDGNFFITAGKIIIVIGVVLPVIGKIIVGIVLLAAIIY